MTLHEWTVPVITKARLRSNVEADRYRSLQSRDHRERSASTVVESHRDRPLVDRFVDIVTASPIAKSPASRHGAITPGVKPGTFCGNEMREAVHW